MIQWFSILDTLKPKFTEAVLAARVGLPDEGDEGGLHRVLTVTPMNTFGTNFNTDCTPDLTKALADKKKHPHNIMLPPPCFIKCLLGTSLLKELIMKSCSVVAFFYILYAIYNACAYNSIQQCCSFLDCDWTKGAD